MIPPIWFVELTRIEIANKKRRENSTTTVSDESDSINFDFDLGGLNDTKLNDLIKLPTVSLFFFVIVTDICIFYSSRIILIFFF